MASNRVYDGLEIAIIGISCQFPGSNDYRQFWQNIKDGKELIKTFSDDELRASGVDESKLQDKSYIKSAGVLENKEFFDHVFFGYNAEEASLMDPQIRLFHEHCWRALEDAGYSSLIEKYKIAVFAGASSNENWKAYAYAKSKESFIDPFYLRRISSQNFISTLVAHKMNLRGGAFYIDTACSTSLAAVHLACRGLLTRECSIALAGGISLNSSKEKGYFYKEGMINSRDGHCRTFDADASGTVWGEGVGVVVLKRLSEALKDGDNIYSIIRSTSVNNDGSNKAGYTAPGIRGQIECIKLAHKLANIDPRSISYIEAHGTATKLGDPVEVRALNEAFGIEFANGSCAIGSVKTNIGHLDVAAGIAGLIKATLCLKYKQIPASLHFKQSNPEIDFNGGPFYVNAELKQWQRESDFPLRAGISSFGIGGTNAHAILEESWENEGTPGRNYKLLTLSAKTVNSLIRYADNLKAFLRCEPYTDLANMAYTLQIGRQQFGYRKSVVFHGRDELIGLLDSAKVRETFIGAKERGNHLVFMFPGQGSQYMDMGKDLYMHDPVFREVMDRGFAIIANLTGEDFKAVLYPAIKEQSRINETRYAQPLIFLLEYSLARLMMSYGLTPQYMIGHSIGEYVAACIGEVFSFEDAVRLVVKRGELMNSVPPGAMISVLLKEEDVKMYLDESISLAAVNGPEQVVLSGDIASIDRLIDKFWRLNIPHVRLQTSHAFHSNMLDSVMPLFKKELGRVAFKKAKFPFISNVTGNFIRQEEAESPDYWVRHLRSTVRFFDGISTLLSYDQQLIFVEVGAGQSLINLLKRISPDRLGTIDVNLIRSANEPENDERYLTDRIGQLWTQGIDPDWNGYNKAEERKRVSLPTYSFEPCRFLAEVNALEMLSKKTLKETRKINDWFYRIQWRQSFWVRGNDLDFKNRVVLIFSDDYGLAKRLVGDLKASNIDCCLINVGQYYERINDNLYTVNPFDEKDFESLFHDIKSRGIIPSELFHFWSFDQEGAGATVERKNNDFYQKMGYESLLKIVRKHSVFFQDDRMRISIVGNGWYNILGNEIIHPEKSPALATAKVIPLEFEKISCRVIDIIDASNESVNALLKELRYVFGNKEVAIRGRNKYVKYFEKVDFEIPSADSVLRKNGTYLITGANGGMGRLFAGFLADRFHANIVLMGRGEERSDLISNLEKKGAKALYIKADVTDSHKVAEGILQAEGVFGKINGVIHTAGVGDFSGIILRRTHEDDEKIFAPKIAGTEVLNSLFKNRSLDFFVSCSSQSASLAKFGQIAYTAGNIYQDAVAERGNPHYPVISIEWPALQEVGMAVNSIKPLTSAGQTDPIKYGINSSEVIGVLLSALFLKIPVPIISIVDFQEYFENYYSGWQDDLLDNNKTVYNYSKGRSDLSSNYLAPETEVEKKLVGMLENLLGIENIGLEDDFFDLGGDSLKAMVLIKRISKEFNVSISLKEFLEKRVIRKIAGEMENIIWNKMVVSHENEIII